MKVCHIQVVLPKSCDVQFTINSLRGWNKKSLDVTKLTQHVLCILILDTVKPYQLNMDTSNLSLTNGRGINEPIGGFVHFG